MLPFCDDDVLSLCMTLHVPTHFYSSPLPLNQCLLSAASLLSYLPWVPVELGPNAGRSCAARGTGKGKVRRWVSASATVKETVYVNGVAGFVQYFFKWHHSSRKDKFVDKTCISSEYRVMYRVIPWGGRDFLHLTVDYCIIANYVQL